MIQTRPEPGRRIRSLDFLRGLAILGMLVANMPWHVGDSMSRVLDPDMTSVAAWLTQYLFIDQRFMPIFCMLFGAGAVLLAESRQPSSFTRFYSVRMALLLDGPTLFQSLECARLYADRNGPLQTGCSSR